MAATGSREIFTLTVFVVALGIAFGSAVLFGVSMALGAFLAGMVVGRSDCSRRAASEALPPAGKRHRADGRRLQHRHRVARARSRIRAVYGDAARRETLESAGIADAATLVLASAGMEQSEKVIRAARELNPTIYVLARRRTSATSPVFDQTAVREPANAGPHVPSTRPGVGVSVFP